jgi:hypothetical protein
VVMGWLFARDLVCCRHDARLSVWRGENPGQ